MKKITKSKKLMFWDERLYESVAGDNVVAAAATSSTNCCCLWLKGVCVGGGSYKTKMTIEDAKLAKSRLTFFILWWQEKSTRWLASFPIHTDAKNGRSNLKSTGVRKNACIKLWPYKIAKICLMNIYIHIL